MKLNCVNLEAFLEQFNLLEQKMTDTHSRNNMLEIMLDDANRDLKFYETREKCLMEERDGLVVTVNILQQTLQEQCNLRVENERLKKDLLDQKQKDERRAEDAEAEVQRLLNEVRAGAERHQRELESVEQQWRRRVEDAHNQAGSHMEAKETKVKKLLEEKEADLEEMRKRLKEQERERQSELLKLQMEFGAKLARVQSSAQWNLQQQQQQQQHGANVLPQSVFKRKLQFFQEEKNKEIVALRQRIKELEESQRGAGGASGGGGSGGVPKKRKM
ncbi:coiled-coil domain-containing protein 152 [Sphaeramia orbicularis]|uniref:coiled-coil domain-containing protein 152 n=1 Tax=Sphaeramia orbicularis TaxID=375764 RepID=UPI001180F9E1|nr:coiled-coil domain-containing protein 152 [Sphaeramia orbicularis]